MSVFIKRPKSIRKLRIAPKLMMQDEPDDADNL